MFAFPTAHIELDTVLILLIIIPHIMNIFFMLQLIFQPCRHIKVDFKFVTHFPGCIYTNTTTLFTIYETIN